MSRSQHELPDRIAGTLINRADLLLALRKQAPEARTAAAAACGFAVREERQEEAPVRPTAPSPLPPAKPRAEIQRPSPAELRFLQAVAYQRIEVQEVKLPPEIGPRPISQPELTARPYRVKPQALQPWSRLWPWLHHVLGQSLPGRQIDLARLVDEMARLRPVQRLPFRRRLAWASQLHILVDGASAMDQFRGDVDGLLARLRQLRGSEGFRCRLVLSPADALNESVKDSRGPVPWTRPEPGDTVLVLSDLGCFGQDLPRIDAWLRCGLDLQREGIFRFALSPCPRDRWDPQLARVWACSPWDRHERMPHGRTGVRPAAVGLDESQRRQMLEALLRACSVPLIVESSLLREMRLRLPGADAGLEHDLRAHPEIGAVTGLCALKPQHVDHRMQELATEDDELLVRLKQALPELLNRHHQVHSAVVRASEMYNLRAAGLAVSDQELADAQAVLRAGNRSRLDEIETTTEDQSPTDRWGLGAFNARELARMARVRGARDRELAAACALEDLATGGSAQPPEGLHLDAYRRTRFWALRKYRRERVWQLRQQGQTLQLRPPDDPPPTGTPLALVPTQTPSVSLVFREKTGRQTVALRIDRDDGRSWPMESPRPVSVASDACKLDLIAKEVPAWATRFGWDRWGLLADFEVGGVTFPLRWIPPGEFEMGSPEGEPGRWDEAGPQQRVTVGHGVWRGETPVTQGQYAAVTGQRPSYFPHAGDQAPVEQVSWDECREFCKKLTELLRELEPGWTFRLPAEAEWEYACRAGTTSALYTGPLNILGECNGPELDPIAWYGGNSGVDYEGGYDSSDWKEKQHDHKRAGTHLVRQKAPNAWGLYDMLGNVWEWCEDVWHDNYKGAPSDGTAWGGEGRRRVCRGGSWASRARFCRCAYRNRWVPGFRLYYLGFRLVLAFSVKEGMRPVS